MVCNFLENESPHIPLIFSGSVELVYSICSNNCKLVAVWLFKILFYVLLATCQRLGNRFDFSVFKLNLVLILTCYLVLDQNGLGSKIDTDKPFLELIQIQQFPLRRLLH